MNETEVVIAGGGPVGMTLALELAHHGVRSILLERNPTTTRHPKMDLTNGRSMELFRRLGLTDELRAVGVPPSEPLDIVWATSATGHVLHRFAYPSPSSSRDLTRIQNDGKGTLEPSMRVSQVMLEPVLKAKIDANPLVDVRFGWAFKSFEQDAEGVTVTIAGDAGQLDVVRGKYLAGCDGGGSMVRDQSGIPLEGAYAIAQAYMVHFHSEAHDVLAKFGVAYHLQTAVGALIAQNGKDIWTLQALAPPDTEPDEVLRRFVGADFDYEILVANPWTPHMLLAETYRAGRVFIAGDAAHQVVPTGGYGMNTGIGDAVDLGWKLSATLRGWGGEALLESYDVERRAVAQRNRAAAQMHLEVKVQINRAILDAEAEGGLDGLENAGRRKVLGARIAELGNAENECWGIEHGYSYAFSDVIWNEAGDSGQTEILECTPSAAPGRRLPSLYLGDGRPLYSLLGPEFTLIAIGGTDVGAFEASAKELGIPTIILALEDEIALEILGARLLLIRPDHHVAWRGDQAGDWRAIMSRAVGAESSTLAVKAA